MPTSFTKPIPAPDITNVLLTGVGDQSLPQKVYSLGLRQILDGPAPGDDLYVGWRYLVSIDTGLALAGEVSQIGGGAPMYAGISYGPKTAKAVRAAKALDTLPGIPAGIFELRVLRIPGLLIDAYWLRADPGGNDQVVPYDTISEGIEEMHVYSMADFLNRVRPLAKKNITRVLRSRTK